MNYQVMQQFSKGPEQQVGQFNQLPEAHKFIKEKLSIDASMKIVTVYRIYELGDLVDEWTLARLEKEAPQEVETSNSSAGNTSQASFRPSPLSTSPRPPGMPPSSFKDESLEKDKK